jgi:hypothetical protein
MKKEDKILINNYMKKLVNIIGRNKWWDIIIQRTTQKVGTNKIKKFIGIWARRCDVWYVNSDEDFRCLKDFII